MEAHIPIEPRCISSPHAAQDEHPHEGGAIAPKQTPAIANPIKTIFSLNNEYLLIGIIIILITVILVLIVYIVKNRAAQTPAEEQSTQQPPPAAQRAPTDASADPLRALANNPFVPQSQRMQQQPDSQEEAEMSEPETAPAPAPTEPVSDTSNQPQQWDTVAPTPDAQPIASQPIVQEPEDAQQQQQPAVAPQLAKRRRATKQ